MKKLLAIVSYFLVLLILAACRIGMGPSVDINVPRIGIDSHVNGAYVSDIINLSGYVDDDAGVKSVVVTGSGVNIPASVSGDTWSASLDTNPTGLNLPDGEHEFVITATDNADKTAEVRLYLTVDNGPTTVLLTSPENYATGRFNKKIVIKGEAADTTRVDEVLISMYETGDPSSPVFENEIATGTTSWYYIYDASGLPLGQYDIVVNAADKSGNINDYVYHFDDLLDLSVDPADAPNIEEIHAEDNEGVPIPGGVLTGPLSSIRKTNDITLTPLTIEIDPNSDDPQVDFISPTFELDPAVNILGTPQRLSGFVEDDDAIDETSLKIAIWDFADNPTAGSVADLPATPTQLIWTSFTPSGNQWSHDSTLPDGEF